MRNGPRNYQTVSKKLRNEAGHIQGAIAQVATMTEAHETLRCQSGLSEAAPDPFRPRRAAPEAPCVPGQAGAAIEASRAAATDRAIAEVQAQRMAREAAAARRALGHREPTPWHVPAQQAPASSHGGAASQPPGSALLGSAPSASAPPGSAAALSAAASVVKPSEEAVADVKAVRTDPVYMASSPTFRDSGAIKWFMETPRKRPPSQCFALAGAASVAAAAPATPRTLGEGLNGYRKAEWPGPAGWQIPENVAAPQD